MAFAVRSDEEHPFVAVELFAERGVRGVLAQIFRAFQKLHGVRAAVLEMLQAGFGRAETIVRLQRLRGLGFMGAVRDRLEDKGIDGLNILGFGARRGFHHLVLDHRHEKILRGGDMLCHLGHRPAIRGRLETPLGFGETLRGLENPGTSLIEVFDGLGNFIRGKALGLKHGADENREAPH